MISWFGSGDGWGTREQAIPGEWALLILLTVLGAVLGLLVLWFTLLQHERSVRRGDRGDDRGHDELRDELTALEIGPAADEAGAARDPEKPAEAREAGAAEEPAEAEDDPARHRTTHAR